MSDWTKGLEHGFDGIDRTEKSKPTCPTRNLRFWMPPGSERTIIFLEDEPSMAVWEHAMKIGGDWRNFATCLCHAQMPCPLDLFTDNPHTPCNRYKMTPFTIIDESEFEIKRGDKAGTKVKNQQRLFALKNTVLEKLARRSNELKSMTPPRTLKFARFKVYRGKDAKTSPSTGDDFSYLGHVDPTTLPKIEVLPYAKLLAPDLELVKSLCMRMKAGLSEASPVSGEGAEEGVKKLPF